MAFRGENKASERYTEKIRPQKCLLRKWSVGEGVEKSKKSKEKSDFFQFDDEKSTWACRNLDIVMDVKNFTIVDKSYDTSTRDRRMMWAW